MFDVNVPFHHWSHTPAGRSKRSETVKDGVLVIEHVATGKLLTSNTGNVSGTVDAFLEDIRNGVCPDRRFMRLFQSDSELKFYEIPCRTAKKQKLLLKEIESSITPSYLHVARV
tara:strand:+ start:34 stop:375 length:342 start_codon:yes stop_codon:yes gene_type:complete